MSGSAVVIGGGIAGIQAALDMANSNVKVFLVEKSPSLGGRMAQLDKTFPTNDCSLCILSPKLVEAARHPNIEILTNSEVVECKGTAGDFKVTVQCHARYVDEKKCTGCGTCAEKCPKKIPSEFEENLIKRKAIYIPFPQAVPHIYSIDKSNCLYFETGKCMLCEKNCASGAVDFEQKDTKITLDTGSIIVATGYDIYSPDFIPEFNYDRLEDVITTLEFERLMSASGPTEGRILRPSDGKVPRSITFVLCAGSRDERHKPYCSRICCMSAIKEAMLAREHEKEISEVNILHMDIRAFGKGFEEYYLRARDQGNVNFKRGKVSEVNKTRDNACLRVLYEDTEKGEICEIESDMVILSSALIPSRSNGHIAKVLGIALDEDGFIAERDASRDSQATSKEGIFACGCAQGPKDVPDSVAQAQAAAARALEFIKERSKDERKEEEVSDVDVPIKAIESEGPRVGVFVCSCGINIGGVVDVKEVAEFAGALPEVVYVNHNLFTCSESTQTKMIEAIKEHNLNRIVVAACTPRTHEPLFRKTCSNAHLNPYLFEMANIREHCSWVHSHEKEHATSKAKHLVRMAVARAKELRPLTPKVVNLSQQALVVGGGMAGIRAALEISKQKIPTILVEKTSRLGGRLNELNTISPSGIKATEVLREIKKELETSKVKVYLNTDIAAIDGFVGNFTAQLVAREKNESIEVGSIVIAMGSELPDVMNRLSPVKYPNMITNQDLERLMINQDFLAKVRGQKFVFILCVGAREKEGYTACSRYCCQEGMKQTLEISEAGGSVTVLYRDIRTFSKGGERMYKQASAQGVRFIRYEGGRFPTIKEDGKSVAVYDTLLAEELILLADYIVSVIPMSPPADAPRFQEMLKIPRGQDGFFLELHPKLAPLQTNMEGVFICGCAQSPKNLSETITQASGAASQVIALLSRDQYEVEAAVARVNEAMCWGCGTCVDTCDFNAPQLIAVGEEKQVSQVNEALCKGCGMCAVHCPSGALSPQHFTRQQIMSMIMAFGSDYVG